MTPKPLPMSKLPLASRYQEFFESSTPKKSLIACEYFTLNGP